MCGNVSGVTVLQEMVSGSVRSHSSDLLACFVCCPVWIVITFKEAFPILWYQAVQKVHCLMCQVQLTVPVGLHHQSNVCCKTWHKKPGTEVCIGCHTLYWQFYQQWTDEFWCVAPVCWLHIVVLGIVCDSRVITETFAFNPHLYTLWQIYLTALPHHISWYDKCQCVVGHRNVMWEWGLLSVEQ